LKTELSIYSYPDKDSVAQFKETKITPELKEAAKRDGINCVKKL